MTIFLKKCNLAACIIMIVTALLGLLGTNLMLQSQIRSSQDELSDKSDITVATIDKELNEVENSVGMIADRLTEEMEENSYLDDADGQEKLSLLIQVQCESALRMLDFASSAYLRFDTSVDESGKGGFYILYDEKGNIASAETTDITQFSENDMEHLAWFYLAKNSGCGAWVEPYRDETQDATVISYVEPLLVDDNFVGVIGMDITVEHITSMADGFEENENIRVLLQDRSGNVLSGETQDSKNGSRSSASGRLQNDMTVVISTPNDTEMTLHMVLYVMFTILNVGLLVSAIILLSITGRKHVHTRYLGRSARTIPSTICFGLCIAILLIQLGYWGDAKGIWPMSSSKTSAPVFSENYDETLTVVADESYTPFSYWNENGEAVGFDVAYIAALGEVMGVNINLKLEEWSDCVDDLANGDADIIMGLDLISGEDDGMLRSEGICTDQIEIYGKASVSNISTILSARIGAVTENGMLDAYGILSTAEKFDSYPEAFKALISGEVDYVVAHEQIADTILSDEAYAKVSPVFDLMESELCYGVIEGNETLLERLNEAISITEEDGTKAELYEIWIENEKELTTAQFFYKHQVFYILTVGLGGLLFFAGLFLLYLSQNNTKWRHLSETDALTGINNRGGGERQIRELIGNKISGMFCLMDVDKFKSINDTYGHGVGDQVLIAVAECLKEAFRERDIIMRLGGDEFAVYVPNVTDKETGTRVIERFFEEIHAMHIEGIDGKKINLSLGASFYNGDEEDDFAAVYRRADKGTYQSKKLIGNQFTFILKENE